MPSKPHLPEGFLSKIRTIVGDSHVLTDEISRNEYGVDALQLGSQPDLVVLPRDTREISKIAYECNQARVPLTPRGAGTGYSGGAVPLHRGVLMSLERLNKILEINQESLYAVVEPHVVTADLQQAVEELGLFYPPDPASLHRSVIGGNVAECAGGPRAFKYGTTKRYVLGLEAVLPTGEIIRTGGKSVKNVAGFDITQLLVGSEGTLAIVTQIILRLVPRPETTSTLRVSFRSIEQAVQAVSCVVADGVVPSVLELIDSDCLAAIANKQTLQREASDIGAMIIAEVDGTSASVCEESQRVASAFEKAGGDVSVANTAKERETLWRERRELSLTLRSMAPLKINHDVVVPKGRISELFAVISRLKQCYKLPMPSFGHAGDGNIHVNIMVDPSKPGEMNRAQQAERALFEQVVALEGSITGEHGVGFSKSPFLNLELSPTTINLMQRIKAAFDPNGILNPGKIFQQEQ